MLSTSLLVRPSVASPVTPDQINGSFEVAGAAFNCLNVRRLIRDKHLEGVRWEPTAFFTLWGVWNLWYYPALEQWYSFAGGCLIVMVNALWVALVAWYWACDRDAREGVLV